MTATTNAPSRPRGNQILRVRGLILSALLQGTPVRAFYPRISSNSSSKTLSGTKPYCFHYIIHQLYVLTKAFPSATIKTIEKGQFGPFPGNILAKPIVILTRNEIHAARPGHWLGHFRGFGTPRRRPELSGLKQSLDPEGIVGRFGRHVSRHASPAMGQS